MQVWRENYWETYVPVVNWLSVRLLMTVARIHGLSYKSIYFVLAFPQADLDVDIFMEIPAGMQVEDDNNPGTQDGGKGKYVIKLKKSLYGLKQAGHNWYHMLREGLENVDSNYPS